MKKRTQGTPPDVTPAPGLSSADALDSVQADLNALADTFVHSDDCTERTQLVDKIQTLRGRLNELKRSQQ